MADNEVLARVEKQNEGITLGLGALAEVLQKMESRFQKQEDAEDQEAASVASETEEEELEEMYKALVKDVSKSVSRQIGLRKSRSGRQLRKQDNQMAELNADKSKKVSGTSWPMSSRRKAQIEETGEDTLDNSSTESVQMPIEAMEKMISKTVLSVLKKSGYGKMRKQDPMDEEEIDPEDEMVVEGMKDQHENGNGAEEEQLFPVEEQDEEAALEEPILEDDENGKDVAAMMRNMKKQVTHLKKQNTGLSKGMEKSIRKETETRLRKMGFREEKGLAGARLIPQSKMGAAEPLVKSTNNDDVVTQLAGLSWNELNEMRFKIETGDTDGIPRELLG